MIDTIADLFISWGAVRDPERYSYRIELSDMKIDVRLLSLTTKAGRLSIHLSQRHKTRRNPREGIDVMTRFDDVDAAKKILNPNYDGLNPYSGKWNHHFYTSKIDSIVETLTYKFSKVRL